MLKQPIKSTPIWLDQIPDKKSYPTLTGNITADVVVIGAGMTGILTAWRLAQKGVKVVVIEKNHVGTGDTGATTGFLLRIPDTPITGLREKKGDEFVSRLFAATTEAEQDIINIVKTLGIDCDLTPCDSYYGSYSDSDDILSSEIDAIRVGDSSATLEHKNLPTGTPLVEAIHFPNEAKWNPRKFLFGLLKHETSKTIQVFEETEATGLDFDGTDVVATTTAGSITTKKIILAIGNPAGLLPELCDLVKPKITYVVTAHADKPLNLPDLYWDTLNPYFYYRVLDDHTLMVGGADIEADKTNTQQPFEMIKTFIAEHFGDGLTITNEWSGTIFHTADDLPYVFSHPHAGGKLFIATGYGGNGMIGSILASQVLGELAFGEMHKASGLLSFRRSGVTIPPLAPKKADANAVKAFVHFGTINDFSSKKMVCKVLNGKKIVVFSIKDHYYAISNICTHAGGSLCDGTLRDTQIECPLHGAKFDVTTGAVMNPPAVRPVEKFAVRVDGENIEVEVPTSANDASLPKVPKQTYWKLLFTFAGFALLFWALQFAWQYFFQAKGDLANSFVRSFAFAGTTLISLALFSSAIFKWWPKTSDYWRFRRYCGVGGFTLIFLHVMTVTAFVFHFDYASIYFSFNPFVNPIIFGSIGFAIFLPMALTSTDWAVDKLTPKWWKRLHRLVYIAYVSSIFHFVSINPPEIRTAPGYLLLAITALALFGQLFWYVKISAQNKFRSLGTFVGLAIIIATIIVWYFVGKAYFNAG